MAETRRYIPDHTLNIEQILEEAKHRWLRPTEILEILRNYQKFKLTAEPPASPAAGSMFLFDRKALRYFRKDGHRWRKKKDGKTVREAHEKLKAGSVDVLHCYYAHGEDNENFQRRCYWMLDGQLEHIVFVHYREVKEAHPSHDKYLNKKLDLYEVMTLVIGKDMATRNYVKSYADVNLEENTEEQSISIENEVEYEETSKGKGTSSSSTQQRLHRKRSRMYEDDGVEKLSKQIGDVAFAIQSLRLDVNALYAEVMKVEGFDEITLGDVFDHLVQNEMLAKAFMAKNANLRKIWVQNFVTQHYNRPAC